MFTLPPALAHADFRRLWLSILCSGLALQMAQVAIGWQVYTIHHSAFDLGLIGLAEFVPVPLLALPAGSLADRVSRVQLVMLWGLADAVVVALLLLVTIQGANLLWEFIALAALTGTLSAVGNPAARSLTPEIVPLDMLNGAIALRSIAGEVSTIGGPALGGLLFAVRPESVYAAGIGLLLASSFVLLPVTRLPPTPKDQLQPQSLMTLLAGIRFIRETKVLLGAITLDLFAVLFGGAVALLPLFAKSKLHTGPAGLGVLRSSIAVGALAAGIMLARKPLQRHAGRTLLLVVGSFGVCMVVFGLSRSFWLSFAALAVSGFVDMFSMNIRSATAAFATPNELRGRVNAVEGVFIGASNELGAFESGAAAAIFGAVPAVVGGGVLTILLALVWPRVFPDLSHLDELSAASLREVLPVGRAGPASAPEPAD
ncbi:MAG TPA: MFS transporter [Gaiellaceae bacterium]|nr:MFS transporter [Gaiellaceae bacterium]